MPDPLYTRRQLHTGLSISLVPRNLPVRRTSFRRLLAGRPRNTEPKPTASASSNAVAVRPTCGSSSSAPSPPSRRRRSSNRSRAACRILCRQTHPKAFRRNFSLTSLGDANRTAVEHYVSDQLGHHRMADPRILARLARYQLAFPDVDLSRPVFSDHGRYVYNLHLVLVHAERWRQASEEFLDATRDMVLKAARQKGHRLSRAAILADHVHLTFGAPYERSPEEIALELSEQLGLHPRHAARVSVRVLRGDVRRVRYGRRAEGRIARVGVSAVTNHPSADTGSAGDVPADPVSAVS